jgi:uncharacterized protein DUF1553/uncharacterized protein DUF1549/cytochrome c
VKSILVATLLSAGVLSAANPQPVQFNRDIRPIMSDTCFRCHGPDKSSRMAGMRLDIREEALKANKHGLIPIVPGDPDKSEIIQRVFATDSKIMPPPFAHKELTEAQKQTIRRWVAEGAKYEGHWSYQPIKRPAVPEIQGAQNPGPLNPIDAFIQERLAREGLQPSPEADRRTLIRRVTLDLTGLPPTPEEVDAFVRDQSPGAYSKVVDRLLASPHYAEKQAMHWLDAVRYADSAGFHGDNLWPSWPYRDYVLRAFRDNKPFDQFTREQLAGDLLPNTTTEQKIASAYNRLNRYSAEGGLQPKEYLAKYGADRVRTLSATWMGSTMGCAECHDHKFDPFTAKDFYSMKAFFADIRETGLMPDRGALAWGTKIALATPEQEKQLAALARQIETAKCDLDDQAKTLLSGDKDWEQRMLSQHKSGALAWKFQRPTSVRSANGAKLTIYNDELVESVFYTIGKGGASLSAERKRGDGLIVASGPNPDNEIYTVEVRPGAGTWTALGIDVYQDENLPGARLARGADRFVLSEVEAEFAGERIPLVLATSTGFGQHPDSPPMAAIDGNPKTGWATGLAEGRNVMIAIRFGRAVTTKADSVMTIRLRQESDIRRATIGRFRVALSDGEFSWPESEDTSAKTAAKSANDDGTATLNIAVDRGIPGDVAAALEIERDKRDEKQERLALDFAEWARPELQPAYEKIAKLELQRTLLNWSIPRAIVTEAVEPRETRVLPRGDWMNDSGEIVEPAVPAFLGKLDTAGPRATRLDLANWLVSNDNPLTARVFVNRMWREFFGTGISRALEDLGSQGEWPVHAELLDWLAAEFISPQYDAAETHPWDMKHVVRTIVLSRAYCQSSLSNPQLDEKDPDNRLIARQSRYRVDAEVVHDVALQVSGLLVDRFGGPSVKPYEPGGYLAAMNFPKRDYSESHGDDLYRRGLYTQWQRTFLHPTFATFDAPTREECSINRVNSNTPLQALVLLNDPIFVESARAFAERILENGGRGLDRQIDWAFVQAEDRRATAQERRILADLYKKNLKRFRADQMSAKEFIAVGESPRPEKIKPADLAAMTTVARAILNLHETITRN